MNLQENIRIISREENIISDWNENVSLRKKYRVYL